MVRRNSCTSDCRDNQYVVARRRASRHQQQQQKQASDDNESLGIKRLRRHQPAATEVDIYSSQAQALTPRLGRHNTQAPTTLLAPHFFLPGTSSPLLLAGGLTNSSSATGGPQQLFGGGSPGAGQFAALTPDARACVTATYLCVLIVNNTWLDCNLLDTLCNTGSSRTKSTSSTADNERDDSIERDARNATEWLTSGRRDEFLAERALESALSGLVAFAGGGRHSDEEDEGGGSGGHGDRRLFGRLQVGVVPDEVSNTSSERHVLLLGQRQPLAQAQRSDEDKTNSRFYLVPLPLAQPAEPDKSRHIPVILHDTGGGDDLETGASHYTPAASETGNSPAADQDQGSEILEPWVNVHHQTPPEKLDRLVDDEKSRILEQYVKFRKYQILKLNWKPVEQLVTSQPVTSNESFSFGSAVGPSANRQNGENSVNVESHTSGFPMMSTSLQPTQSSTTPLPATSPGGIVSWVGRPFRGWSSYSFWSQPSSSEASALSTGGLNNQLEQSSSAISELDAEQQQVQASQVPLHRQQGGMQILRPVDRSEQFNNILTNGQSKHQQQTLLPGGELSTGDQIGKQHQAIYTHQPLFQEGSDFSASSPASALSEPSQQQMMTSSPSAGGNIVGSYSEYPAINHQFLHQQQQQQQQHFMGTTTLVPVQMTAIEQAPCSCDHLINDECRLQCLKSQQQQQHQQQVSTMPSVLMAVAAAAAAKQNLHDANQMLASGSSYATSVGSSALMNTAATTINAPAATTLAPSSISSSSGKMNPLDVSFLLYTRYNRDLAQELTHLVGLRHSQHHPPAPSQFHQHHHHLNHHPHQHHQQQQNSASSASNSLTAGAPSSVSIVASTPTTSTVAASAAAAATTLTSSSTGESSIDDIIELTNETALGEARINSSLPIKIIIHGFGSGGRRPWVTDMVYKLLDYEDVNVIVVDWEKGAVLPNYVQAAGNTRIVGHKIAALIKSINAKYGLTGNRYHLIGFSLGAHVAGFAGMEIRNSTNISRHWINRITGLDPASPLFEGYEANDRLDPTDAQFVDVIHSNGDGVLRGGFGSLQPMGHVDFYPNGGRVQVGCNSVLLSALSDIIYGKWQSLCNHRRALNFFMDSFEFNKCRFRSFSCDSYENYLRGDCFDCGQNNEKCSYMGYLANYSKGRGKMYLTTHEEAPFCANQFIIKIIGTRGHKTHWGKVEVTLVTVDGRNESFWLSSMHSGQSSSSSSLTSSSSSSSTMSSSSSSASPSSSSSVSVSPSSTSTSSSSSSSSISPSSGGYAELGSSSQKESMQQSMQSLIVAHPTLVNFTQILLRYTKYKGWIYSGDENWPIDKVFITDSEGQVKSFCGHNTILESHIITRLSLEPGNCTVVESQPSLAVAGGSQLSRVSTLATSQANGQPSSSLQQQQRQDQQQQSSRTPRLLSSLMHHQSPNTGGASAAELHHNTHQASANQPPMFAISAGHTVTMQRLLAPNQQQFTHHVLSF